MMFIKVLYGTVAVLRAVLRAVLTATFLRRSYDETYYPILTIT